MSQTQQSGQSKPNASANPNQSSSANVNSVASRGGAPISGVNNNSNNNSRGTANVNMNSDYNNSTSRKYSDDDDLRLGGDGGEEVKFNFESASGVEMLVLELKNNIDFVSNQMEEFKVRLSKAPDQIREGETAKVELEESKLEIEEENKLLQEIVAKGIDSSGTSSSKIGLGARGVGMMPAVMSGGGYHDSGPRLGEGDIRKALLDEDDNENIEVSGYR